MAPVHACMPFELNDMQPSTFITSLFIISQRNFNDKHSRNNHRLKKLEVMCNIFNYYNLGLVVNFQHLGVTVAVGLSCPLLHCHLAFTCLVKVILLVLLTIIDAISLF